MPASKQSQLRRIDNIAKLEAWAKLNIPEQVWGSFSCKRALKEYCFLAWMTNESVANNYANIVNLRLVQSKKTSGGQEIAVGVLGRVQELTPEEEKLIKETPLRELVGLTKAKEPPVTGEDIAIIDESD